MVVEYSVCADKELNDIICTNEPTLEIMASASIKGSNNNTSNPTTTTSNNNTSSTASGARIPHLIKWIKHRVKKENRYTTKGAGGRNYTSEDVENIIGSTGMAGGLSSISKEAIQLSSGSSSCLLDSTQDSSDTFSGHTIVSDSSYDAAVKESFSGNNSIIRNNNNNVNKHIISNCTGINKSGVVVNNQGLLNTGETATTATSTMGVVRPANQNTPITCTPKSGTIDVSICKHGCLTNRCRACMQLPPLPPGSERVLRELQRQAKQKLRSQSQVQFGSTGNIHASPILSKHHTIDRNVRNSFHEQSLQLPQQQQQQQQQSLPRFQHHGQHLQNVGAGFSYNSSGQGHGSQFVGLGSNSFHGNVQFQHQQQQPQHHFISQQQHQHPQQHHLLPRQPPPQQHQTFLPPRSLATSPEHVYEEIPVSFFQSDNTHPPAQTNTNSIHHQTTFTNVKTSTNTNNNYYMDKNNSKFIGGFRYDDGNHQSNIRHSLQHNNNYNPSTTNGAIVNSRDNNNSGNNLSNRPDLHKGHHLKSHEFYPQNMHSSKITGSSNSISSASPAKQQHPQSQQQQQQQQSSQSRQVSLGNLDFGMAKECDGFLVVPLRDRNSNSSSPQTGGVAGNSRENNHPGYWVKDQVANGNDNQFKQLINDSNVKRRPVLLQHSSSSHVIHHPSDSGFHDDTNIQDFREQTYNFKKSSHLFQPIYAHARTHSVDAVTSDTSEKFSHCKKCGRPHALYHGVSLCHSEVEDMRQELQYLDIAGLDKNKLRGKTSVLDSPSLLYNFTRRRSAFSKYIPSSQKEGLNCDQNLECVMKNDDESSILMSDSYKRQSMSAESDYFSSNYNTSQSDTLSRASREYQLQPRVNYVTSSDRSNDTFSEYDVKSEIQHQREDSGSVEYHYYLEKVKQNLEIKQEVKRIIRSSESEWSDCERSYQSDNFLQDDSISLTSVTSLSELSTMPMEESSTSFIRSRMHHKANKGSPKSSKSNSNNNVKTQLNSSADAYVSKMQRVRKPIRKKRKDKSPKDVEYYKLPNFAANSSFQQFNDIKGSCSNHSRKTDIHKSSSIESKTSVKTERAGTPSDKQDSSSSCYSLEGSEKLSCRVTDFKLSDMKRTNSFSNKDANKSLSIRATTSGDQSETKSSNRGSVYSSHNQVKSNTNNRLLSDLMRMNHDKQLFSFI